MREAIVVVTTALLLTAGSALANPLGSMGELGRQGHVGRNGAEGVDCQALRRSADLRARLRPSERRALIERCERTTGEIRLADHRPIADPGR